MRICIISPGCRLNQAEIESVATALQQAGHRIITGKEDVDLYIINSCSVTARSERRVRTMVERARENMAPGGQIILTGCATEELRSMPGITFIPNDYKNRIPDIAAGNIKVEELPSERPSRFDYPVPLLCSTRRVNVKIQDGCDNFCSYCIIPSMRGVPVSKPLPQVIDEVHTLTRAGFREIVLSGANIGKYRDGRDGLGELLGRLLELDGEYRVHIPSLDPECLSPSVMKHIGHSRLVNHIHLSLQSGSDRILRLMNRRYTSAEYLRLVDSLRERVPLFNITTDVITGFPGEEEEDHRQTLDLVQQAGFSHVHTFRFSPRPGTAAAAMEDTVPGSIKMERSRGIMAMASVLKNSYHEKFIGKEGKLLVESCRGGKAAGHTEYYIPVELDGQLRPGEFTSLRLISVRGECMTGGIIRD